MAALGRAARMSKDHELPAQRAVHLRVGGRVQGVGFRYYVIEAAARHGVRGFVRNLTDGDVEIHAEGPADSVEALVEAVRLGPRFSHVDRLDRTDREPTGTYDRFEVRY